MTRFPLAMSSVWRPLFTLFGMPASSSFAEVDPDRGTLRVKAGIWFDETLPLNEVADVVPSSFPWYGGLGVKLGPGNAVSVVGSGDGVVAVHFKSPQRMRVVFEVNRPELRLAVEDPPRFMQALRDARPRSARA